MTIKTSDQLLAILREKALRPMTPQERYQQRVSFIMGMLDSKSTLTRADVERHLENIMGRP